MTSWMIYLLFGLVWLAGAAFVYSRADAEGRNGSLWGIAALLTGPIAWVALFVVEAREPVGYHAPIQTAESLAAAPLHMGHSAARIDPNVTAPTTSSERDPYIEKLIQKGNLKGAKDAIHAMVLTAKETHDTGMLALYERYSTQIRHIELEAVRRDAASPVAGPPTEFTDGPDIHGGRAARVDDTPHQALI